MEEQKEFRIKITSEDDIKKSIAAIKSTASSTLGFKIDEPKIVIAEDGKKEIIVSFHDSAIDEEIIRRK